MPRTDTVRRLLGALRSTHRRDSNEWSRRMEGRASRPVVTRW
jgi:hypothetical protein